MAQINFFHYTSRRQLESDVEKGVRQTNDLVFVSDETEGTLIWTHGKYFSLSETEFKKFFDLYTADDILMGSYIIPKTADDITGEDSVNTAISKLDSRLAEVQDIIGDFNTILENVLYTKE